MNLKSDKLSHNFNNYGVYCEIQSAELIFNDDLKKINDLDIDIKELKNEGCNYIISTKKIMNFDSIISKPILYENFRIVLISISCMFTIYNY